jgi:hypothetical protein
VIAMAGIAKKAITTPIDPRLPKYLGRQWQIAIHTGPRNACEMLSKLVHI